MREKNSSGKVHTPSAYDAYLHSTQSEDLEEDIGYFESRKPQRESESVSRGTAARKKSTKRKGFIKKGKKAKKERSVQRTPAREVPERRLSQEYLEMKAQKEHQKKQRAYKNDRLYTFIAGFIITVLIFTFSILTLTGKVEQYSDKENRYLAGRPQLSASAVKDGKFMDDMENYLSDQFAGRSALVKTRTAIDILCGKKEMNGVYIGKNHFLFEKPTEYNEKGVAKTVNAINDFTARHQKINSYMAIIPNATSILSDYLPANVEMPDRHAQITAIYKQLEGIQTVDTYPTFEKNDQKNELYYKTDHHWTTKAAEIAFKQIAANMKLDISKTAYNTYAVTNQFQGTLASSSGLFNAKDTINICVPKTDVQYVVTHVSENKKVSSVFDASKLEQQNKYEVFFGGNEAQINIQTTLNSKKVLMVVKDSYANCLIPMLIPYYKSIVMIDPRYYTDDIETTLKNEGVTDILWLYNADTFIGDSSICNVF